MVGTRELPNHTSSSVSVKLRKPHGNRGEDTQGVNTLAVLVVTICIKGISVDLFIIGPESFIQIGFWPLESLRGVAGRDLPLQKMSEVRKWRQGFESQ